MSKYSYAQWQLDQDAWEKQQRDLWVLRITESNERAYQRYKALPRWRKFFILDKARWMATHRDFQPL